MAQIWSKEYWTSKNGIRLHMFRKRADLPSPGDAPLPVLFLVHGSSMSARSTFDLSVPGRSDYSLMDCFAQRGFDVWTMDHEGYGRSDITAGNADVASGAQDLEAAMPVLAAETGRTSCAFFGASSGSLRAARFAMEFPEHVERLVLSAMVYTGAGSPTLARRAEKVAEYRANHRRKIDRAFFHGMHNRDKPGTSEAAVADAMADAELALTDSVPTGTYLDMCANLPVVDPARITCPVQIIRGEYDGIATEEDLLEFFRLLPIKDKQFVLLAGMADSASLGLNRHKFWHAMHAFLTLPKQRPIEPR